ncbi:unnamed protein product [Dovyalis caffra]|uniref:Uncharacterized protein n=1 Tax=Dovyalis caffra TaxID=77055 RepID=A0AAV1RSP1_9ROSI|nr:unnamed protein product [Dovyalis caffra]
MNSKTARMQEGTKGLDEARHETITRKTELALILTLTSNVESNVQIEGEVEISPMESEDKIDKFGSKVLRVKQSALWAKCIAK